jgi:hypothetical protein
MSATEALMREIDSARLQYRPLLHIRVTQDAIPGAPAAVPITPERARSIRLRIVELSGDADAVVVPDPEVWLRSLEIVVHPEDWTAVLLEHGRFIRDLVIREDRAGRDPVCDFMGVQVI